MIFFIGHRVYSEFAPIYGKRKKKLRFEVVPAFGRGRHGDVAIVMHVADTTSDSFLKKLKVCIYALIIVDSHEVIDTERLQYSVDYVEVGTRRRSRLF